MHRLLIGFGLVGGLLSTAFAADYDLPILRAKGPATFTRWGGFYVAQNG